MFKVFGTFTGRGHSGSEWQRDQKTKFIVKQAYDFEVALKAMDLVLDDRVEEGLQLLKYNEPASGSDQTVTVLARGVIEFLEATLGFEGEAMKKAASTLSKAENLSLKSRQNAQKMDINSSSFYPPGTVYAVTYTESCLLHALVMLFSESMVEAAKALLKLRKAYSMLQEILDAIRKVELTQKNNGGLAERGSQTSFASDNSDINFLDIPYKLSPKEQQDRELLEYASQVQDMREKRICGAHIGNSPAVNRLRSELGIKAIKEIPGKETQEYTVPFQDLDVGQATIDEFILSGVNLCFGILQVVLSLIPPAIGAVLSIVGFRGSREEGLRLVWRATKYRNVHGCIGLQALMFYYDGPFQFTDVDFDIPLTTSVKSSEGEMDGPTLLHPGKILENALLQSRAFFPNSALWLLNEARMLATHGRLSDAVDLMDSIDVEKIQMRQVRTLLIFDRAIILSQMHSYERAAEDLLSLIEISDWSHAFYTYYAGACYLENWRMYQLGLRKGESAEFCKKRARDLIFGAPKLLGKKTFKSKNLPLDRFMLRKVEQFGQIQEKLKLSDPLDAIATSPVHEIAYFYNGYNRMTQKELKLSQQLITEYHNPAIDHENVDQELIKDFLFSLTLRRLGEVQQGSLLLDKKVLPHFFSIQNGKVKYIKKQEDPWLYPAAFYERALFSWKLKNMKGLAECKEWLTRAQNYSVDYELSTRIGMKIKAALDRVEHSL
ncbi:mitochondrial outer membrane protein iml2 [Zygosaccharomyces mellis]|uniref:Mitochondrial outer membrane protein iml2 n=1 Tax=Zygosaccharomyces mellis TaxID=42258 RepID=A0A4C2ECY6_9SACH|nr:mitochondrial outer membrane protein iml2 [Zygosaccharomyces mellis]